MASKTHIDITLDLQMIGKGTYDLRIPVHQPVRQLLQNLKETLRLAEDARFTAVKVVTKQLLLADDDRLADYPVADGDVLFVLAQPMAHTKERIQSR